MLSLAFIARPSGQSDLPDASYLCRFADVVCFIGGPATVFAYVSGAVHQRFYFLQTAIDDDATDVVLFMKFFTGCALCLTF